MNLPNLLLNIDSLHSLQLLPLLQLSIIARCSLFPPGGLFLRDDGLARDAVEDIATLGSQAFEVCGHVGCG